MRIYMIGQKGIPARGGGIERHVEELATRLAKRGHEVFVYCRAHYTPSGISSYKSIRLIHLPTIRSKHLDAIVHTLFASIHVLFQRADIIHYHAVGPALLLWIPRLFKRSAKVFFTFHCQDYHHEKWGFVARLSLRLGEASGCRFAHAVIAVSKTLARYAWTAYQCNATYIPNGAPSRRGLSSSGILRRLGLTKGGYILAVARLIPGREPLVPPVGVKLSRKMMFFNPTKAIRELGLPQTPVREALQRAVVWFARNGYLKGL